MDHRHAAAPAAGHLAAATVLGLAILAAPTVMTPATAASAARDATAAALDRCLATPANASTAGQTDCAGTALRDYDRRMNTAYATLLRRLPPGPADRLRRAQRAWLAYRDAEAAARGALYATRQGTMYVPMEAAAAAEPVAARARTLEGYVRLLAID